MTGRLGIGLLLLAASSFAVAELDALQPGPAALTDYHENGKWLIVMLWASDCHVCSREAAQYVEFHERHRHRDARMLGVSLDGADRSAAREFMRRNGISFPSLITDYEIGSRWFEELTGQWFQGTPGFLVYDQSGVLRAQQIGAVPVELIEDFIAGSAEN